VLIIKTRYQGSTGIGPLLELHTPVLNLLVQCIDLGKQILLITSLPECNKVLLKERVLNASYFKSIVIVKSGKAV
jgi:hypothetical protein